MHLQMQKESDLVHFYQMLAEQTDAQKLVIHDIKKHLYAISLLNNEYSVTSEPLNPLHRATHSECRSHPYEKVNPLLRATS